MFRDPKPTDIVTCARCQALLSETLDGPAPDAVRGHLHTCAECAAFLRDTRVLKAELRALPRPHLSAGFEAALLARLETIPARTFRTAARPFFRPLLTAGACAVLAATALFVRPASVSVVPTRPAVVSAPVDPSLVGQCVAQHRADLAAQPLADPAAQALSDHLAGASADAAFGGSL